MVRIPYHSSAKEYGPKEFDNLSRWEVLDKFKEAAASAGLVIGDVMDDGAIHRCGTTDKPRSKNGAYGIWIDDGPFPAGWFMNWRLGKSTSWCLRSPDNMTISERVAHDEMIKKKKEERQANIELARDEAKRIAVYRWASASPLFLGHPYLSRKKINRHHARMDRDALLIPIYDETGELVNIQFILPNGDKRPVQGGPMRHVFSLIGKPDGARVIRVAEGFSTAATIHELTGDPVFIAMNCHNLAWTASHVKVLYPSAHIVVCGDTDKEGRERAAEAAKGCMGKVVFPAFPDGASDDLNDFNDLCGLVGAEETGRQLADGTEEAVQPEPKYTEADIEDALKGIIFDGDPHPPYRIPIIKNMVPRSGASILGGQWGSGKTFVALDLAVAVASGQPFFGKPVRTPGGIFYLAAEGFEDIQNRLEAAKIARGITEKLPIAFSDDVGDLFDPKNVDYLVERIKGVSERFMRLFGVPVIVVVIDTIAKAFMLQKDDGPEAARGCKILEDISKRTDTLTLASKHYGKDQTKGLAGSHQWAANVKQVYAAIGEHDHTTGECKNRKLIIDKNKEGPPGPVAPFDLKFVKTGVDPDGEDIGSMCIAAMLEKVLSRPAAEPAKKVKRQPQRTFEAAINTCLDECKFDHVTRDGDRVIAVALESVRRRFNGMYPSDQEDPKKRGDTLRQAFKTGREASLVDGFYCLETTLDGDVLWLA